LPSASQQPSEQLRALHWPVHVPSDIEQNSSAPQGPSQREPQPSGSPHALPAQLGVHARRIVVSMPGSPNACRLALEKLVIPELSHLIREVSR